MKISIIIPNYNSKHLLEKNLPKIIREIEKLRNYEIEIIIVDDDSTDGSIEFINQFTSSRVHELRNKKAREFTSSRVNGLKNSLINNSLINNKPIIKLIRNRKNSGFSSSVNQGVREAEGELLVLLNTDVYPEKGFLEPILPHFKDAKVFSVGMLDKSIEGDNIVRRGRGIGEWRRGMYVHRRGEVDKTDTAWVSGGSGAFRTSIWKKLSGFDEIYNPFYWEDIDLSYRAVKKGYKILFEPKSVVIHEHGKGIIKLNYNEQQIKTISYRNQFLFIWKNANFLHLILHFLWLPYHLIRFLFRFDFTFFFGFFWAIKRKLTFRR